MSVPQLFFFDVDGTLLDNRHHRISPSTLRCLRQLQRQGQRIVISSGRDIDTIATMPELAAIDWDGYICRNGSVVADRDHHELFRAFFKPSALCQLEALSHRLNRPILYMGYQEWSNLPPNDDFRKACTFFHRLPDQIPVRPTTDSDQVTMALAFGDAGDDYQEYAAIDSLTVLPTRFHYADLVIRGIDKSTGMRRLCDHLNIPMSATMAFGDGINDLQMIREAGTGVAMGQGCQAVKEVADFITDSVDQNGIEKALQHFGLLRP